MTKKMENHRSNPKRVDLGTKGLMKDWLESVSKAPKNELPELPDVLRNCKPEHIVDPAPSKEEIERVE
jgi:hypothetical protein